MSSSKYTKDCNNKNANVFDIFGHGTDINTENVAV